MSLISPADITNFALNRTDEFSDGTSSFQASVQQILDEVWAEIILEEPWLGLRAYPPQAQITQPASMTLLLTTTSNSTAASLSAAPIGLGGAQVSIQNWWIMPTGKTYYLRVAAHSPGSTAVTLDTVAPENLTTLGCVVAQLEYSLLPGTGVLTDALWTEGNGFDGAFVPIRTEEELKLAYPGIPQQDWPPRLAARITPLVLRFSHFDITPHRFEVPYNQELAPPSATSTTILALPFYLRPALAEGILAILHEMKKDDRRGVADARYTHWISRAKEYEMDLKTGTGDQSNQRRNEPYGEGAARTGSPYS